MKTTSIGIENLCVPCHSFCRYCLLSSCGKATGVEYDRGKQLAKRLYNEIRQKGLDLKLYYYIGYCMDDPNLEDYIRFSQEIDAPSARFLQLNGLKMRDAAATDCFIEKIFRAGIEEIDLTFYGTREYHDQFAGRSGDFDYLLRLLLSAKRRNMKVHISCPIHKENMGQIDGLLDMINGYQSENISVFLPHGKGRGKSIEHLRLSAADFDQLSSRTKIYMSKYRTEREWLKTELYEQPLTRALTLCLEPNNIEMLESMPLEEIVEYLETLDEQYYRMIPDVRELAKRYGRYDGDRLYRRFRDLHLEWQQKYLADAGEEIWDMNDETHHFSVRM